MQNLITLINWPRIEMPKCLLILYYELQVAILF